MSGKPRRVTIAYAGAPGAFAHESCLIFAPEHEPIAVESFAAVAAAVAAGRVAKGMLPLRNSRAGPVPGVADLLSASLVLVESEHALPVRMHMLACRGAQLADIRIIRSHPMALTQCADHLKSLGIPTAPSPSTADAAKALSSPTGAALASAAAADIYDLEILLRDLQDDPDNRTIFGLIRAR